MIPQAIAFGANTIAAGVAAYTDWKTGYIFDWITYPLMVVGIAISVLNGQYWGLVFGAGIYLLGYFAYKEGKLGGGDVKLLAGMAAVQPLYHGMVFVLSVLLVASVLACVGLCAKYVGGYLMSKPKIDWNTPRKRLAGVMLVGVILFLIFARMQGIFSNEISVGLFVALGMGIIFYGFESEIKTHSFLQRIPLEKLEDDELLAVEHLSEDEKKKLGNNISQLVDRSDIARFTHAGMHTLPVYRNLPKFAPFLFLGVLVVYLFPQWLSPFIPMIG